MGNTLAPFYESIYATWATLWGARESRILILGLDGAGKTTLLYKIKLGEVVHTIPTIGFNVETFRYKNIEFTAWDVGGQCKLRPLWRHYTVNTDAVLFVVDAADRARLAEARQELHYIFKDECLQQAKLLVYANKQDHPDALPASKVFDELELNGISTSGAKRVQSATATSGDGIYEGLEWLTQQLL